MIRFQLFFFVFCVSFSGMTQSDYYRITFQPGFDYSYQLTQFRNGVPADFLGNMGKHHLGGQLSVNFFISEKVGINLKGFAASKIYSQSRAKYERDLQDFLESYHAPHYYVNEDEKISKSKSGEFHFLSIGGVYRIIKNKWNYQFGFNIGMVRMQTTKILYHMKEHGSNYHYSALIEPDMGNRWSVYFEPSAQVSYTVAKRLGIFVSGSYSISPLNFHSKELQTNLYTNEHFQTKYSKTELIQLLSVKLGLSIGIGAIVGKQKTDK